MTGAIVSQEPPGAMPGWEWKRGLNRCLICVFSPSAFNLQIRRMKKDAEANAVPGYPVGRPGSGENFGGVRMRLRQKRARLAIHTNWSVCYDLDRDEARIEDPFPQCSLARDPRQRQFRYAHRGYLRCRGAHHRQRRFRNASAMSICGVPLSCCSMNHKRPTGKTIAEAQ